MKLALSDDVLWLDVLENSYTNEKVRKEGLECDRVVRKHIMLSAEMGEISAISNAQTAHQTWETLRDKYESVIDPVIVKREFYGATIKDQETVKHHIDNMYSLRTKMEQSGTPVSKPEFLTTLKCSILNPKR